MLNYGIFHINSRFAIHSIQRNGRKFAKNEALCLWLFYLQGIHMIAGTVYTDSA